MLDLDLLPPQVLRQHLPLDLDAGQLLEVREARLLDLGQRELEGDDAQRSVTPACLRQLNSDGAVVCACAEPSSAATASPPPAAKMSRRVIIAFIAYLPLLPPPIAAGLFGSLDFSRGLLRTRWHYG